MVEDHEYQMGLRDGKIKSLEKAVSELTNDLKSFKQLYANDSAKWRMAIGMLYGAIALVQFLPEIRQLFGGE